MDASGAYPYSRRPLFRPEPSPSREPRPLCKGRGSTSSSTGDRARSHTGSAVAREELVDTALSPYFSPSTLAGCRREREAATREREREYCLRPATVRGGGGRDGDDTMWGDRRWREAGRTATAQRAAATTDPCIAHRSPLDDATATNKSADKAPAVAVALLIVFTATANGREGGRESEARGGGGRERERESGERRESGGRRRRRGEEKERR
uniref:Uncharacterized protein n=1 Tax=Oryza nivara TaxID=4536 RepID=A0A0E0HS94_ORYNI